MPSYYWTESPSDVPDDAVKAGDDENGNPIYVGRVFHNNHWIPAKVIPSKHSAYIPVGSKEVAVDDYQILCGNDFIWSPTEGNRIPRNAFIASRKLPTDEPYYVGRVEVEDRYDVGMVESGLDYCCITWQGRTIACNEYEILLQRN